MSLIRRSLQTLLLGATLVSSAFAANTPQVAVAPKVRITAKVDVTKKTTVVDSVPGKVAIAKETGRLAGNVQLTGLKLVLKGTDEQEIAADSLLDQQQDRGSSLYHQWMTPEAYGAAFGAAKADIAKVTSWMADAGLKVESVSPGGRIISFSGSASAIEAAFSTELHTYTLNGESRFANATPISFPEALSPVVMGVAKLNNFALKSGMAHPRTIVKGDDGKFYEAIPGTKKPDLTSLSSGNHYVGPWDVSTIYNAGPLTSAGIDGTGVTIGIIGQSMISLSNVETFRSAFKLPVNDPVIINVGVAPLQVADDIESDLDVEWAGAVATGAKVLFGTASYSFYDDGVDTSSLYFVDNNNADILSMSYGGCETGNGSAGTAFWNTLWKQAAAQGQSVFISTGDSAASTCTAAGSTSYNGVTYGVNALGSSAYNTAVGGTGFFEGYTIAYQTGSNPYWGPGGIQPYGTALSYIPEDVYSEGAFDLVIQGAGTEGGGGGVSIFTGRPSWQVGVGISPTADPAGPTFTASGAIPASQLHRLVPDLSGIATGGHDGTIFCSEGVCSLNPDGTLAGFGVVGGTSVATPTTAGFQALINQKNGGRQGNANYYYYKLAAAEPNLAACASTVPTGATAATPPAATCNFHDVITGNNYAPKTSTGKYTVATQTLSGTLGTDYIGFAATQGYDEATGLGSPNVANLANNWSSVTFNSTTTKLTMSQTTFVHGTTVNATIAVTANSGTAPVPTGNVTIQAIGVTTPMDGNVYTLTAGSVTAAISNLPGGTYNLVAKYAGDSIDGGSTSAPVQITVSKEPTLIFVNAYLATTGTTPASFAYGTNIYVDTDLQGSSATGVNGNNILNTGIPTGVVNFSMTSPGQTLPSVSEPIDIYATTYLSIAQPLPAYYLPQNYPLLIPGTYVVTAAYPGDNSFQPISGNTTFIVAKASSTPNLTVSTPDIKSGGVAKFSVTVATSGSGLPPTGNITLTDTTTNTVLGTAALGTPPLVTGAVDFTTQAIVTLGTHSITATYAGDSNYATLTSTAKTITVIAGTGPTLAITNASTVSPLQVENTASILCTSSTAATATTSIAFYDAAKLLGNVNMLTGATTAQLNITSLIAGLHNVTCSTPGTSTVPSATSNILALNINPNTPSVSLASGQAGSTANGVSMNSVFTANPALATLNPLPLLPMSFYDGTTLLGTAPIVKTLNYGYYTAAFTTPPITTPGYHVLTAQYAAGDPNYNPATSPVQNIAIGITTTTVTSSVASIGLNLPFTLSAKITPVVANSTPVTGQVVFKDGGVTIGTYFVGAGNVASGPVTLTTLGNHIITATYLGDANYYTSTGTLATTVTVVTPSLQIQPGSLTIPRGQAGLVSITATGLNGYNGSFVLSCSNLPAFTTCAFGAPIAGNSGSLTQTIAMSVITSPLTPVGTGSFLWIPALFLAGFLGLRRKQLGRGLKQTLALVVILCGAMSLSGCGKATTHYGIQGGSPLGTTTVTVTAVGTGVAPTPNITLSGSLNVTITAQ